MRALLWLYIFDVALGYIYMYIRLLSNKKDMPQEDKDPKLKGVFEGNCNRVACQVPEAVYYNHSTRLYYCEDCAHTINRMNPGSFEIFGHVLCTKGKHIE